MRIGDYDVEVPVIVDVAEAGRDASVGERRSGREVTLAVVEPELRASPVIQGGQAEVQVFVAVHIPGGDSRQLHRPAAVVPNGGWCGDASGLRGEHDPWDGDGLGRRPATPGEHRDHADQSSHDPERSRPANRRRARALRLGFVVHRLWSFRVFK